MTGKKKDDLLNIDFTVPGSQKYLPEEIKTQLAIKFGHGGRSSIDIRSSFQKTVPGPGHYYAIYEDKDQERLTDDSYSQSRDSRIGGRNTSRIRGSHSQAVLSGGEVPGVIGAKAKGKYSFSKSQRMENS